MSCRIWPMNDDDCTIIVKLDKTYDDCTAEQLVVLKNKLSEILKVLPDGVLRLCTVEQGCYELTYQMPAFIQEIIFPLTLDQEAALKDLNVVWLCCGQYEFSLQQTVKHVNDNSYDDEDDDDFSDVASQATAMLEQVIAGIQACTRLKSQASALDSGIGMTSITTEFTELDVEVSFINSSESVYKEFHLLPSMINAASFNGILLKVKFCIEVLHRSFLYLSGNKLLHVATDGGCLEIVKYLIEECKCHPAIPLNGKSPIHSAAFTGCLPLVKYFLKELKIDPLLLDSQQKTPLHYACQNGSIDVVDFLLEQAEEHDPRERIFSDRTKLGNTVLHFAAASGNCRLVQHLIEKFHIFPSISGQLGATPLLIAVQEGHLNVVEYLVSLENSAANHTLHEKKQNAIHIAAKKGHLSIIIFLINKLGLNATIPDIDGCTPLHLAALNGHIEVVQYLIEKCQCELLCLTKKKRTPLHLAAEKGHLNVVSYFVVQKGLDPLSQHLNNVTPLHLAVKNEKLQIVVFYIEKLNVKLVTPSRLGEKLLFKAVQIGSLSIVQVLANKLQCWTNITRGLRQTQLIFKALAKGHLKVLKYFLIERCWEPFLSNKEGSLLHIAAAAGHLEIVKFLINTLKYNPSSMTKYDGLTPLHKACQGGNVEVISYLINESNVNVNAPSIHGFTPLHIAALFDSHQVIECLLQSDESDLNHKDKYGRTPLHYAATFGKLEPLKYLISKDPDSMYCNSAFFGYNSLLLAVFHGHLAIVKYLVSEMKVDPNILQAGHQEFTPLHIACQQGHKDIVNFLLSNANCLKDPRDFDGDSPLHSAVLNPKGTIDFIKFLIDEKGYDPMHRDYAGNLPLHTAAQKGSLELVKYFCETLNINPSIRNRNGMTPLRFAARIGNLSIVKFLTLEKNCDPMCRENYGNIPAFYATRYEHYRVLKFFLHKLKVDLQTTGDGKRSFFHEASAIGNMKIWNLLISLAHQKHLHYNKKDEVGVTPLHLACFQGHINIIKQILHDNPCTKLPVDNDLRSPLHWAAKENKLDAIKLLTQEKGFDLMNKDINGNTPLHYAARSDYLEIIEFCTTKLLNSTLILHTPNNLHQTPLDYLRRIYVDEIPRLGQNHLHLAAEIGKVYFMKRLLKDKEKTDPNCTDQLGRTPLHYAAMRGQLEAISTLLNSKANLFIEDVFHNLPLHYAAALGYLDVIKVLIKNKSPYNTKGLLGLTPIRMATAGEHDKVTEFLSRKLYLITIIR